MKTHFRSLWMLLAAFALSLVTACTKAHGQFGDPDATLRFWRQLNEREDMADLGEAMKAWEISPPNSAGLERQLAVLQIASECFKRRNDQIAALSMKDVDPALLEYTAKLASLNAARITLIADARGAIGSVQGVTDSNRLLIDALASLMRNAKAENPFTAMLREQFFEKVQTVGEAIPKVKTVAGEVANVQKIESDIVAQEIAVRAALHSHHPREFPPSSSFQNKSKEQTPDAIFTRRRLSLDVLGHHVGNWTFETPSEIRSFEITKRDVQSDKASIAIVCLAIGKNSGNRFDLSFTMNYKKREDVWVLTGLSSGR